MYFGEALENQKMYCTPYRKCVLTFMYPRDMFNCGLLGQRLHFSEDVKVLCHVL